MISVYTDGACSGNPGIGGWGVVILETDKEEIFLNYQKIEKLFKDFKLKKVEGNKTILLLITIGVFLEQLK